IVARFAASASPSTGVADVADTSAAAVTSGVADSIAIVSWNVHVGGGSLEALVDDLRSGRLTGTDTVRHFVLLLQEAYREGELVPEPAGQPGGGLIEAHPVSGARRDIVADAEALGLSLFYAPSMRNGPRNSRGGFEDRGNAILSSLPLLDPFAIELPAVRQRRVATTAYVEGRTSAGEPWRLQITSVHLENDAEGWLNSERGRLIQTERLLDALPISETAVVGGDFNTWTRGPDELVVRLMRDAFPDTPSFPPGPTYERAYGVVGMYLDYVFFRLPDGADADYERLDRPYNSDHYPLLGWVALEP
ncbi:MAG: endonuclease/exonuclease/phosphatase family protein, partial [Longimicrobiales bacterium]